MYILRVGGFCERRPRAHTAHEENVHIRHVVPGERIVGDTGRVIVDSARTVLLEDPDEAGPSRLSAEVSICSEHARGHRGCCAYTTLQPQCQRRSFRILACLEEPEPAIAR